MTRVEKIIRIMIGTKNKEEDTARFLENVLSSVRWFLPNDQKIILIKKINSLQKEIELKENKQEFLFNLEENK